MIVKDKDGNIIRTGYSEAEREGKRKERKRRAAAKARRKKQNKLIHTSFESSRRKH